MLNPGRFISHVGRFVTGIEIHPGAQIGPGLFIDHGMGVVIGEFLEVGANCTLYQGVTLGGTSLKKEKRHPTLGQNIVVGAGAKILGAITIGDHSKIGAGSVVVTKVPPHSTVVGIPGRVVQRTGAKDVATIDLDHHDLPDPEAKAINYLVDKVREMERELHQLRQEVRRARHEIRQPWFCAGAAAGGMTRYEAAHLHGSSDYHTHRSRRAGSHDAVFDRPVRRSLQS